MPRKLSDAVVVITGASSGIGRAAALRFADRGATVVVAARRGEALRQLARECQLRGSRALALTTDVTVEDEVDDLARKTIERFGRIDVWINNAAVSLFGRFEETPTEAVLRVFQTNPFGYLYGARAALPYFREQGGGVLINVDSVVADAPQPFTSAYVASKYAIRGMFECLRMELALDGSPEIHVCTVLPASIDTPPFQQAANYTGRAIKALDPVYPPEQVADALVSLAEHPRREIAVGNAGRLMIMQHNLAPSFYESSAARQIDSNHFQDATAEPTHGNLFRPMPEYAQVSGGWQNGQRSRLGKAAAAGLGGVLPPPYSAVRDGRLEACSCSEVRTSRCGSEESRCCRSSRSAARIPRLWHYSRRSPTAESYRLYAGARRRLPMTCGSCGPQLAAAPRRAAYPRIGFASQST